MPKMDGFTLCKKIREQEEIPILFITAKVQEVDHNFQLKSYSKHLLHYQNFPQHTHEQPNNLLLFLLNYHDLQLIVFVVYRMRLIKEKMAFMLFL